MKTALDFIGDLRAATTDLERVRVLLSTRGLPRWEELRAVAEGYDRHVLAPDRLVEWAVVTDTQGRTDQYEGVLTVAGVELVVPDMETITRRWSTRPGWYVLDRWESDEWVQSAEGSEHRDAPRRCLETVDAYLAGKASIEDLRVARTDAYDAAADAADAADASAAYAAASAAYAAYAAAVYAADDVASAANAAYSAYAASSYAASADAADESERAQERVRWHADWRWHLVHSALEGNSK